MNMIRQYLRRRRIRRLAERCLASQILFGAQCDQEEQAQRAINTAKAFYDEWSRKSGTANFHVNPVFACVASTQWSNRGALIVEIK